MEEYNLSWYQAELKTLGERYATRQGLADNRVLVFQIGQGVERVTYFHWTAQGVAIKATGSIALFADWAKGNGYESLHWSLKWKTLSGEWDPPVMKSQLDQQHMSAWEIRPPIRKEDDPVGVAEDAKHPFGTTPNYHHYVSFQAKQEAREARDILAQDTRFEQVGLEDHGSFFRVNFYSAGKFGREEQHSILRAVDQAVTQRAKTFAFNREVDGRWLFSKDWNFLLGEKQAGLSIAPQQKVGQPMAQQKQGFFSGISRFFGGGSAEPDADYDVLPYDDDLDDDTSSGAVVPAAPRPGTPPATNVKYPPARRGQKLNTSTMSQEQLRTRRMNVIEGSKFGRPFHEAFMLFILRFWLVLGPIAFVALTTSEVAYILTSLAAPGDKSILIIGGGALFIDLAMMFTTFGVAIKRRDLAEKREANGGVLPKREEAEVWFGTLLWLVFAAINITGQSAFLLHIVGANAQGILVIFIISRVAGFILGDASTAFFLAKVDNSHLKLIARGEREKAGLYSDIAKAEGERRLIEAKAEAEMVLLQLKVQQEQDDANFLANLKQQVFDDLLHRRPQLPPPAPEGPNKSRLRRLDSEN